MQRILVLIFTLILAGRAMTLAFISSAGSGLPGAPPAPWLMPLIGDAVIGITALLVAYLFWKKSGLWVWTAIIVWNSIGIWDAMSAFIIHHTAPWPEFFMTQIFGSSMFFIASAMHVAIIYLVNQPEIKKQLLDARLATA